MPMGVGRYRTAETELYKHGRRPTERVAMTAFSPRLVNRCMFYQQSTHLYNDFQRILLQA